MNKEIKLPPHLQALVKKINEQQSKWKIEEIDCDQIFKMQEDKKSNIK